MKAAILAGLSGTALLMASAALVLLVAVGRPAVGGVVAAPAILAPEVMAGPAARAWARRKHAGL